MKKKIIKRIFVKKKSLSSHFTMIDLIQLAKFTDSTIIRCKSFIHRMLSIIVFV